MTSHTENLPLAEDVVADPRLRLLLLTRLAGTSYAEIERAQGLQTGAISGYVRGQRYAYPKLRQAVTAHLAEVLGRNADEIGIYLFPSEETVS